MLRKQAKMHAVLKKDGIVYDIHWVLKFINLMAYDITKSYIRSFYINYLKNIDHNQVLNYLIKHKEMST